VLGKKIFVSYKYGDRSVQALPGYPGTTARDYVDVYQDLVRGTHHINKGENDNESLAGFKDETIESKLRDKIYDSSVTIVFISKQMDDGTDEKNQWIPWEVSYSLKEVRRADQISRMNAVLAVVIPDKFGVYDYYLVQDSCPFCHCRLLKTAFLFGILRLNMFNVKGPTFADCRNHSKNTVFLGDSSYIESVKWSDFIADVNKWIDKAVSINEKAGDYEITKLTD